MQTQRRWTGAHRRDRFAYVDTREQIGCMTEVFEWRPALVEQFTQIAAASAG